MKDEVQLNFVSLEELKIGTCANALEFLIQEFCWPLLKMTKYNFA